MRPVRTLQRFLLVSSGNPIFFYRVEEPKFVLAIKRWPFFSKILEPHNLYPCLGGGSPLLYTLSLQTPGCPVMRPREHRQDLRADIIRLMSHQLFHAPLPLQNPPPVPCCTCRVDFRSDVLQRHRRRASLLVALPIRVLALSPAVRGLLAARAALEPHTLLAAVGAALRARRHRRGCAARTRSLPSAPSPPSYPASRSCPFQPDPGLKIDCKNGTDQAEPSGSWD